MAIFRLEAKVIGRSKGGRSIVACSAYRSALRLKEAWDNVTERVHDYTRRTKGVINTVILRPDKSPEFLSDPNRLWNLVEKTEKRKDAQLAREFVLALPRELNDLQQWNLAVGWASKELVGRGMVAEVSLHHPKSGKNPHCHILCTMRRFEDGKFGNKAREWNDKGLLKHHRASWADAVNAALEKAGRPERVDHRSLKDRGIDRLPEPKIGVAATAMKRRGAVADPERFKIWRFVKSLNAAKVWRDAIRTVGEVYQEGAGRSWWERSLLLAKGARQAAREAWDSAQRGPELPGPDLPPPDKGFEPSR